jgi:gas vesicle protein
MKFVLGALVGAAVALMLAPKSGEDLREDLSNQVDDSIERGKDVVRKVSRRARELGDQAQEQFS